ncbi:MAG: 23S rRNA (pseudouridine(1915)-N(3))-methyltransferase RlmH [Oscillospiraceae bacterium]|nr:23S rRNA (pseudouridine(1915)-N(3))-methyltransferase RlmH [Oscillospiraceae bacterium]
MLSVDIICVGKLKEKFFADACDEYKKRMGAYCKLNIVELAETPAANESEVRRALSAEAERISAKIPKDAYLICMCIEGKLLSSEALSEKMTSLKCSGKSRLCFIIGGSNGIDESIKARAELRLSMSPMTFPHHLARVMLLEQIYRAFKIEEGSGYHK